MLLYKNTYYANLHFFNRNSMNFLIVKQLIGMIFAERERERERERESLKYNFQKYGTGSNLGCASR